MERRIRWLKHHQTSVAVMVMVVIVISGVFAGYEWYETTYPNRGPCPDCPVMLHESVIMQSYSINSPTNLTLTLKNTGSIRVYLFAYKVAEPNGAYFANTSWTGPAIDPNQVSGANILIDGRAFTFQSSQSYTVTITTSRDTQFPFQV